MDLGRYRPGLGLSGFFPLTLVPSFLSRRISHRPNLVKIVDNIGWLFFDKFVRMGMGLLVGVWVARYLGPERFGLLSFSAAFAGLFSPLPAMGLPAIVVRDLIRDPESKEESLGTAAVLQFIGGLFSYAMLIAVIFWLRPEDILAKTMVAIIGTLLFFKTSDVAVYWFESQVQSKYMVWVQNGVFLVFVTIKIGLILSHSTLIAFAWIMMAEAGLVAIIILVVLGLREPQLRNLHFSFDRAKYLLVNSWPFLLAGVAITIYVKIDQIMLGQMMGNQSVGIYSSAVRISEVFYFIPVMITASVFPAIMDAKKQSEILYYDRLQKLFNLMVWISIFVALPMTFLSSEIIKLLFGAAYAKAGPVLSVHIWAAIFVFLGVASTKWYIVENRQILSLQRAALGAITNVFLNLLLIPNYGAIGAAWATVVSYGVADMFFDLIHKDTRKIFKMKIHAFHLSSARTLFKWDKI